MLYVIDPENFNGCIVAKMNDDTYINYTALKLSTYKIKMCLPCLEAVTIEEFEKMREEYIACCQTGFTPAKEEEFYACINKSKIRRHFFSLELKFFYLEGEESAFGIHPLYVCYKGKYYTAQKDIKLSPGDIRSYIENRKSISILSPGDAGHHTGLYNYMQEHGIGDIMDFFDTQPDKIKAGGHGYSLYTNRR